MSWQAFWSNAVYREASIGATILVLSFFLSRWGSRLSSRLLLHFSRRTATALDDQLVEALRRPLRWMLFLLGVYYGIHRSPLSDAWVHRTDAVLFAAAALAVTVALIRTWTIVVGWYARESAVAGAELASEFGPLLSKAGRLLVAVLGAVVVLHHFGVNVQSVVVSLGVGSLAIGLAAQDTLANMFGGFTLMLDRPFRLGERIKLASGEVGDVEAIGLRATRIHTVDDTVLVVPNSVLVKERIVNQSRPTREMTTRLELGVAYGSDLGRVKTILREAALASDLVNRDREPAVLVTRLGDSAIHLQLVFWVLDFSQQGVAVSAVNEAISERFSAEGIEIPPPGRRFVVEGAGDGPGSLPRG